MGRDDTERAGLLYHTYMKLRLALPVTLIGLLAPTVAVAEWVDRDEDGIMGTRIDVELWADDPARGGGHRCRDGRDAPVDRR